MGFLGGDGTSCVIQRLFFCYCSSVSCKKIRDAYRALFLPVSKMPSDDDSSDSVYLDSIAAVNTVGFPFLDCFQSACIISFIESIYIYIPFLLFFHHPPLELVDRISGKLNMFTLVIPKRIYISAGRGPAEDFVAVNPIWVAFSFADDAGGKKPRDAHLTKVK